MMDDFFLFVILLSTIICNLQICEMIVSFRFESSAEDRESIVTLSEE
jgi:hypothetical protein